MKWYTLTTQIENRNKHMNNQCIKLVNLIKADGLSSCILKGQGNALLYPNPLRRQSGDIDIWIKGGKTKVLNYVRSKCDAKVEIFIHHMDFPILDTIEVEAHFIPSYSKSPFLNIPLQRYFREEIDAQCSNHKQLPDGTGEIPVPTDTFNAIYVLHHIYKHLFTEGIGLRQIMDYYYLMQRFDFQNDKKTQTQIVSKLKAMHLLKFASALMYVLQKVFGMKERNMIVAPNTTEGEFLLNEIMTGGNFGTSDQRVSEMHKATSHIGKYLAREKFTSRLLRHYPEEVLWSPLFGIYGYLFAHWHKFRYNRS